MRNMTATKGLNMNELHARAYGFSNDVSGYGLGRTFPPVKGLVAPSTVASAAKWLRKHKQTNKGKNYAENTN